MATKKQIRNDGEAPSIYLDYYMNMDAQSFGIAAFQYDGEQLFVTGGAECSEWPDYAGSLKCDILKDAAGLQGLCENLTGASGEREGWTSGPWYDWDGASDSSLSGGLPELFLLVERGMSARLRPSPPFSFAMIL